MKRLLVTLGLLLWCATPSWAAIAHVQTVFGQTAGAAGTVTVSLPGATAGNAVIVSLIIDNGLSGLSIAQTAGDTLTSCAEIDSSGSFQRQYSATSIAGGTTSFTFTFTSNVASIYVSEFSGVTTSPCDKTASTTYASGTTKSSGTTATLTQADEVCYASFHGDGSGGTTFTSLSNSYTSPTNGTNVGGGVTGVRSAVGYKIVAATTACETTLTVADSFGGTGLMGTYKAAAAPSGTSSRMSLLGAGQ